ncbi:MAG TPA: hypothetical protein VHI13_22105 [Candidatus Kapabacteria bacterium]|nr:hypothetical protein [Candidatus Kapabacteria bacterium]
MTPPIPGQTILVVEEGFNMVGYYSPDQAIADPVTISRFSTEAQNVINAGRPFTLVLGPTFESAYSTINLPCAGLAAVAQLQFLQTHLMTRIVMKRPHDVLSTNAQSLAIQVVSDPDSWQQHIEAA